MVWSELITGAVLIIIIVVSAIIGAKKGFIRMVAGLIEYIVSFFLAYTFCSKLTAVTSKIPFIADMMTDTDMPELPEGAGLFEKAKETISFIVKNTLEGGDTDATVKAITDNYIANILSTVIAFVAIFLAALLVQKILVAVFDLLTKNSLLGKANRFLGFLFGALVGSFWTWGATKLFVSFLLPMLTEKYPESFPADFTSNFLIKFFLEFNPVSAILNLLSWIADKI